MSDTPAVPPTPTSVADAREALRLAVREHDREIERMQHEDAESHVMPLADALIAAVRAEEREKADVFWEKICAEREGCARIEVRSSTLREVREMVEGMQKPDQPLTEGKRNETLRDVLAGLAKMEGQ